MSELTSLLKSVPPGHSASAAELLPLVYEELRKIAAHRMANAAAGHTLQPTALVHEAWLRLSGDWANQFASRAHFFAAAAEAMRHILIDSARRKQAARHGGGQERVDIGEVEIACLADADELLAVHEALDQLAAEDAQQAELAKLRYFVGLTFEEAAEVLGISVPSAKRHWAYARAWLYAEIRANPDNQSVHRSARLRRTLVNSLLKYSKARRGRTSAWQWARGLPDCSGNQRFYRPGAPTGRFLQQPANPVPLQPDRCDRGGADQPKSIVPFLPASVLPFTRVSRRRDTFRVGIS